MNGNAVPPFLSACRNLAAIVPLAIWSWDSFFSICRVQGSSMEPTLFSGDIVVVRRSDGLWQRWKWPTSSSSVGNDYNKQTVERERILTYEKKHCNSNGVVGLLRKPPTPITGNMVVFKDPAKYPDQWIIERVVATGGDAVRTDLQSSLAKESKHCSTTHVPPYCMWLEADNLSLSENSHSRGHGPVSKKLLVGIAEYRLWPPWRFGKLDSEHISGAYRASLDSER